MSLRWRIAVGFALVALATAAVVALATPPIVGGGFQELDSEYGSGPAASAAASAATTAPAEDGAADEGTAPAPATPAQIQQSTIVRLILAALAAAAAASLLGLLAAGRLVRPLVKLEHAAAAVARGDLARRSGLADRRDEFGSLGRTFDSMAGELQLAEDTRRGFLQDAAHELKTPLAVIDATSTAILEGVYKPERRHIETIRDQSRVLARIVDDLRTISLAEGGHLTLERRSVDAAETLMSVAAAFEAEASGAHVSLSAEAPPDLAVDADPDRLRQMLAALADNALRHTPEGGSVRLSAAPAARAPGPASARAVRFVVEDTGPGIPPEALPHIFERFYQADPSHSREAGTSGLGLSIVEALARAHGGRAGAQNLPAGGAQLWFELPEHSAGPAKQVGQGAGSH